jgi:hypothetical protein
MPDKQSLANWIHNHAITTDTLDLQAPLDGLEPLQGHHLAQALGDDYVAIAATSNRARTARIQPDSGHALGFKIFDRALQLLVDGSVEAALPAEAPLIIADLHRRSRRRPRCRVLPAGTDGRLFRERVGLRRGCVHPPGQLHGAGTRDGRMSCVRGTRRYWALVRRPR